MIRGRWTDEESSFFEPFVVSASPLGGRLARDHRRVLYATFWIARTGAPWHDLSAALGNWNSVFRRRCRKPVYVRPVERHEHAMARVKRSRIRLAVPIARVVVAAAARS